MIHKHGNGVTVGEILWCLKHPQDNQKHKNYHNEDNVKIHQQRQRMIVYDGCILFAVDG